MLWYHILAIVIAGIMAAYVLLSLIVASKLLDSVAIPKGRTLEQSRQFQIDAEKWDYHEFDGVWNKQETTIITKDNLKLYTVNIINPNATTIDGRAKVAIIAHGHICNHMQSVKYANIFYQLGYNIIVFDQRYFGNSEGYCCTLSYKETGDLALVIDKAKQLYGDDAYIALHGESMGGACVLNVLASKSSDVALVVADCAYADSMTMLKENCRIKAHYPVFPAMVFASWLGKLRYDYDIKAVRPRKVVATVGNPICYIHGTEDRLILPHHSVDLYKSTRNQADSELHLVQGGLHARCHLLNKEQYIGIVKDFVMKIEQKTGGNIND